MNLQKRTSQDNKEEFSFYKDSDIHRKKGSRFMVVPQKHPADIYVDVPGEKQKIPLTLRLYIGGLSVIGIYIIYRMLQKSSRA